MTGGICQVVCCKNTHYIAGWYPKTEYHPVIFMTEYRCNVVQQARYGNGCVARNTDAD